MHPSRTRVSLHPFTAERARRVVDRAPTAEDRWAQDYPFADELDPLRSFAARVGSGAEPHPFTLYQIVETDSGHAIGGLGFFSPPDTTGTCELGYGLVASARGRGYATEALLLAIEAARAGGARRLIADTAVDNPASQRVLQKAGFTEYDLRDGAVFYELTLAARG